MNNVDFRALITKSVSIFLDGIECDDQGWLIY
jgi:hypothetical protein